MSNSAQFLVELDWHDTTAILRCTGTIDMLTAPVFEQQIGDALARKPSATIVDLTLVDFISSGGLWVLLDAYKQRSPAIGFAVVADGPTTLRPMKLMGLTDIFSVRTSLQDALADLTLPGPKPR